MSIVGVGRRVRVYLSEGGRGPDGVLYVRILDLLRVEGCAGATAIRGVAGFGADGRLRTGLIVDAPSDLPIVVEWIDTPERVERVLPKIKALVADGLITVETVEIVHQPRRAARDLGERTSVRDVMSRDVVAARPDAPLASTVRQLVESPYRALPVVDPQGRVVGIVTNSDLVERGGLGLRVELLRTLSPRELAAELAASERGKTVADVMTSPVATIGPAATLADAAHLMVARSLKRVPVVDERDRLLGMVSRVDLLRTSADAYANPAVETPPVTGRTIGEVMRRSVPTVRRDAPLAEVLDAVVSTRLNRALVVDEAGRVIGAVTDAELVRRLSPKDHPGVVRVLMSKLPFASLSVAERREIERSRGVTAEALMIPSAPTVGPDTPIGEAIALMLSERRKILPVVGEDGRLLGAVDRADLLRLLVEPAGESDGA